MPSRPLILLLSLPLLLSHAFALQPETVKVGVIAAFTGDGAFWGDNFRKGIELAAKDINAAGGIDGRQLELILEDDQCDAARAVTAYQKIASAGNVTAVLGPVCSSAALAIAPLARRHKLPTLICAESADVPTGDFVFRLWVPNDLQGRRLAKYAKERIAGTAAIIASNNSYGQSLSAAFRQEFEAHG